VISQRRPGRAESPSKQKLRLWLRLLRLAHSIEVELRRRFAAEFATTLPKFDVMAALWRAEHGMNMTELSRHLMVSNGNVTGIVERLVAEANVERLAQADDRRATFVRLTGEGAAQFASMAAAHENWIEELLSDWSSAEIEVLSTLLASAHATAGKARSGTALGGLAAHRQKPRRSSAEVSRLTRKRGSGGSHVR
jgi:DNA-binding MarR family transcriptional regulator